MNTNQEINISVILPSRERPKLLHRVLVSFDLYANFPNDIEYLIWLDDDDDNENENIEVIKKLKKRIQNMRYFVCPRIGHRNVWFMFENLIKVSKGKIIFPVADDYFMRMLNWDMYMCRYIEETAFIGWRTRFGFTKKLLDECNVIEIYKQYHQKANERIMEYAYKENIMKDMGGDWFGVAGIPSIKRLKIKDEELSKKGFTPDFDICLYEK